MATAPAPAWVVGHTVHLRLSTGEEVQGQVFAVDEAHNMLATRSPGSHNGVERVRVINTGSVEDVLSNQAPATCSMELPTMFSQQFPAFLEQCRARERKALQQAEREASRVGAGVTQEAQGVFDALCKTLPCSWQGKTIVVLVGGGGGGVGCLMHAACGVQRAGAWEGERGGLSRMHARVRARGGSSSHACSCARGQERMRWAPGCCSPPIPRTAGTMNAPTLPTARRTRCTCPSRTRPRPAPRLAPATRPPWSACASY